jgi:hypothetical protein
MIFDPNSEFFFRYNKNFTSEALTYYEFYSILHRYLLYSITQDSLKGFLIQLLDLLQKIKIGFRHFLKKKAIQK